VTGVESVVEIADFSGGEFGRKGADTVPPSWWTGSNVWVNQDGTIGPRPGLFKHTVSNPHAGTVWGINFIGQPGKMLGIVIGNTVYQTDTDTDFTLSAVAPTLGAEPTEECQFQFYDPNGHVYLTNPAENTYDIDWTAATLTSFTVAAATHGFRGIQLYRDRLYLFCDAIAPVASNPGWRVYFSEPADFTNFPAVNQFDVGYFWDLYAAVPLGNHLFFPQRQTGWWAMIGGSPATLLLRQVRTDPPAFDQSSGASQQGYVLENGQIWYFRPGAFLAISNGSQFDEHTWQHLQLGAVSNRYGMYFDNEGQDVFFVDQANNDSLIRHWGVWCFQRFDVDVSGQICQTEFKNRALLVGSDDPASYYSLRLYLDRPGFIGDTNARPGDDSDTPVDAFFYTPQFRDKAGRNLRVKQVIVNFDKFDWGGLTNSFDVEVRTYSRANTMGGSTDNFATETQSWTESTDSASVDGREDEYRMNPGEGGYGTAWQIGIKNIVGCRFTRLVVVLDLHPGRSQR
jgi:hypothetical protein